jgi:hypothetical protein
MANNPIMIGVVMAGANLPAKKYTKTTPTVSRLSFEFDGASTQFIDIAKALSIINRKFYRQGVYYYVNSVEVYNNETGVVDLHTLHDTWVTKNAWNRGFKIWQQMNALASVPQAKYKDFKVYMSDLHRTTGSANPAVYTINAGFNTSGTPVADNWRYSQFVSADSDGDIDNTDPANPVVNQEADNFYIHMIGDHVGTSSNWESVGLIRSYGETRTRPQNLEPSTPPNPTMEEDPLLNLFDMSTEEVINDIVNLSRDNRATPYNADTYIGDNLYGLCHVARVGTEVGVGRVGRASGFCAPFGLICVDPHGLSTAFRVVLNLAVGTYHGVYAERA